MKTQKEVTTFLVLYFYFSVSLPSYSLFQLLPVVYETVYFFR